MKRKSILSYFIIFLLVLTMLLGACSGGNGSGSGDENDNDEKVYKMDFQGQHARPQYLTQYAQIPFLERLNEKSEGRIDATFLDVESVVPKNEIMNAVATNLLQLGVGMQGFEPGRYPASELMGMPFIFPSSSVASLTTWHIYEKYPEFRADYPDDVVILSMFTCPGNHIHTVDKPVQTLEDMKGLRIIPIGGAEQSEIIESLGAIPITIGTADWYTSLERGLADGILLPFAPMRAFQIVDVCKYHTLLDISQSSFYLTMNKELYESLPDDLRELINEETGVKFAEENGYGLDYGSEEDLRWMLEQPDHEWIILPEEEKARFAEAVESIKAKYVQKLEGMGYPAAEMMDEINSYVETISENEDVYVPDYVSIIGEYQ